MYDTDQSSIWIKSMLFSGAVLFREEEPSLLPSAPTGIKAGPLYKLKGKLLKGWKQYWFAIDDKLSCLIYYEIINKNGSYSYRQRGTISLTASSVSLIEQPIKGRRACVRISQPQLQASVVYLASESEALTKEWSNYFVMVGAVTEIYDGPNP